MPSQTETTLVINKPSILSKFGVSRLIKAMEKLNFIERATDREVD